MILSGAKSLGTVGLESPEIPQREVKNGSNHIKVTKSLGTVGLESPEIPQREVKMGRIAVK